LSAGKRAQRVDKECRQKIPEKKGAACRQRVSTKSAGKRAQRVDKECRQKIPAKGRSVPTKSAGKKCRQKNAVLTKAPASIGLLRRKK